MTVASELSCSTDTRGPRRSLSAIRWWSAVLERGAQVGSRRDAELREDPVEVRADRPMGEEELLADFLVARPLAAMWAIWSSCGESASMRSWLRRRLVSPDARNSWRARSPHGTAASSSKVSRAARSRIRESAARRCRRSQMPCASCRRARTNGQLEFLNDGSGFGFVPYRSKPRLPSPDRSQRQISRQLRYSPAPGEGWPSGRRRRS